MSRASILVPIHYYWQFQGERIMLKRKNAEGLVRPHRKVNPITSTTPSPLLIKGGHFVVAMPMVHGRKLRWS
jgi:hypothetical protein